MRAAILLLALLPALALGQTVPSFAANGDSVVTCSNGTVTPATTTLGTVASTDMVFLVCTSEAETISLSTANNFATTGITRNVGTAATDPGIGLHVFYVDGSSWTSAPVVADSGNHTCCALHRYANASWGAVTATGITNNASTGTGPYNLPSYAYPFMAHGYLAGYNPWFNIFVSATSFNGTSTTECSFDSYNERFDSTNTVQAGGGHCLADGTDWGWPGETLSYPTVTLTNLTWWIGATITIAPTADTMAIRAGAGMSGFFP